MPGRVTRRPLALDRGDRARTSEATRRAWKERYRSSRYQDLPWFSPRPYPWIADAVRQRWWIPGSSILDIGCGAGSNALFLARHGFKVTGIDLADGAIAAATSRAEEAGVRAEFRVADALQLPFPDGSFGGALDIGCFHTLPPRHRRAYSREIARVLRPRRTFALSWVAREFAGEFGPPHRLSLEEATQALEEEFLFQQSEYRPSASGRRVAGELPVYCARLGRRSFARPPPR